MSDPDRDRAPAAAFPRDDVISVLHRQHADIRDALAGCRRARSRSGCAGWTR